MSNVEILRVVVVSNISGTVLTDYATEDWTYNKEDKAIGSLFRTLVAIAKDFDEGIVHFVSFKMPASTNPAQSRRGCNSEPVNLNLALTMKNAIITGVFYKVKGDDSRVVENENPWVEGVANKIYEAFAADHLDFYCSIKPALEEAFQKSEDLPQEMSDRFAAFSDKIPGIISQ